MRSARLGEQGHARDLGASGRHDEFGSGLIQPPAPLHGVGVK